MSDQGDAKQPAQELSCSATHSLSVVGSWTAELLRAHFCSTDRKNE